MNDKLVHLLDVVESKYFTFEGERCEITGSFEAYELDFIKNKISTLPENTYFLDIGVGKGVTTVLGAIFTQTVGVDPYQTYEHNNSVCKLAQHLCCEVPLIIEEKSIAALEKLFTFEKESGNKLGMVLVDGDHRFDSTMIDFSILNELSSQDTIILFDDCYYRQKLWVIRYILKHYDFKIVPNRIKRRNLLLRIIRFIKHWFNYNWSFSDVLMLVKFGVPLHQDSYLLELKKISQKKRPYYYFGGM